MSDLESLSNAELRAKCIELSLPNIPVTDTSRNVIIKRLRQALSGVSSPAAKKTTTNRRETIAVTERSSPAKNLLVSAEKISEVNAAANRVDKRRTLATAGTEEASNKLSERRASMTAERRAATQSRRTPTMVVLDSDEEDEVLAAVQKAEQQQQQPPLPVNTRRSSSRQPSLSRTTTTVTTEFKGLSAVTEEESPSVLEKMRAKEAEILEQQKRRRQQEQLRAKQEQREQMLLKQQQEEKERLINQQRIQKQLEDARSRYNAANRKPVQLSSYVPAQKAPYKPTTSLYPQLGNIERTAAYTEFSDDTDADVSKGVAVDSDEEKLNTPFLSEFARNLNRLKAEPLLSGGDLSRRYTRSRTAHEVKGRVAMPRYGHEQGEATFWQNLVYLNNRYNLLRHLFLVAVIILVVYIFMNFWQ